MVRYGLDTDDVVLNPAAQIVGEIILLNMYIFEWLLKPKSQYGVNKVIVYSFITYHIEILLVQIPLHMDYIKYNVIFFFIFTFIFFIVRKIFPYWEDEPELDTGDTNE